MKHPLVNKIGVVCGSSYGLGRAIAIELSKNNCQCALIGRTKDKLQRTKDMMSGDSRSIYPVVTDITKWSQSQYSASKIIKRFGRIDFLINNASGWSSKTLLDINAKDINELVDITLKGTMFITKAFLPYFIRQKS